MLDTSKTFVLDTSALFCLKEDEPGAADVDRIFREAGAHGRAYICFISLMEFFYISQQEQGENWARRAYLELKQLPLHVIESDEELCLSSARIKAKYRMSVADAWVAATAERLDALLVHKDPEFEQLKGKQPMYVLPYKGK